MTKTNPHSDSHADSQTDWWKSFHVAEMGDVLLARSQNQLQSTHDFFRRELNLKRDDWLFDQCCGIGSLSIPLIAHGVHVVGCDLFAPYIEQAKTAADNFPDQSASTKFFCADAFKFVTTAPCDVVINWYSSFGYASEDATNTRMLDRAFDSLKPGGHFALDIPNVPGLLRRFKPNLIQEGMSNGQSVRIERSSQFDFEAGLLKQQWDWHVDGKLKTTRHSAMKIYLPNRVCEMLHDAGFDSVRLFGDVTSEIYEMDSPRLIITARKPA